MTDFLNALVGSISSVSGPLTLVAFLALVFLAIFYRSVDDKHGLEYIYKLVHDKLTRDQFYQLARLNIILVFVAFVIVFVLSIIAFLIRYPQPTPASPTQNVSISPTSNNSRVIEIIPSKTVLNVNEQTTLTASLSVNVQGATFLWSADYGAVPKDRVPTPSITYTAPSFSTTDTIRVTVQDKDGNVSKGEIRVSVAKSEPTDSFKTPTPPLPSPTPAIFRSPTIIQTITGVDLPGYSKQSTIVRDSKGKLTLFVRYDSGDLAFSQSTDGGKNWSKPSIFDRILPPGGPQVSAAVDSGDRVHIVWGRGPESGDAIYGLLDNGKWVTKEIVGTGAFARDIAVDSANNPHIVWTGIDLSHVTFDGKKWIGPEKAAQGAWHPDIQINSNDQVFLFMNSGGFYPQEGVSIYVKDNISGLWSVPTQISTSPFWSGGAVAAIDSRGNIYVCWIGSSSKGGGADQVFFSRYIEGKWQEPFPLGDVNTSAGSTGAESPSIAFDSNDVLYVFWRGLNERKRPVIFARALATESSKVSRVTQGWSPIIQLDDRSASDVGWPSVADVYYKNRITGVGVVWRANVGTGTVIEYSHVTYP